MSLELNKIAASVLTAGVVAMGTGFVANLLVHPEVPEEPVYQVAMQASDGGQGQQPEQPSGPQPIQPLLADADTEAGRQAMRACGACHSFEKGGANKVGPNLYGVVGNEIASHDGFGYSNALSEKEGEWTYEKLNAFLHNPSEWAPGTNMSYPGIKEVQKRANVIAWLRQNDDDPMALPTEEEIAAVTQSQESSGDGEQAADGGGDQQQASGDQAGGSQEADTGDGNELAGRLQQASASAGEKASRVCAACHSFNKGGPNKVGPNLYGTVGKKIAGHEGFSYSDALKGKEGEWTYAKLDAWLENPNEFAPGNRMTYPGLKDPAKRADVIKYMAEQGDSAPPLPGGDGGQQASGGESEEATADQSGGDSGQQTDGEQQQASGGDASQAGDTQTAQAQSGGGNALLQKIASADPATGKSASRVCVACHSFDKGGPNKVGPNIYGVIGSDVASADGFNYSDSLKGKDGSWTYEKLDAYLENPSGWAPGTRMTFPGVKDADKRAAVIAYLREHADNAPPLE